MRDTRCGKQVYISSHRCPAPLQLQSALREFTLPLSHTCMPIGIRLPQVKPPAALHLLQTTSFSTCTGCPVHQVHAHIACHSPHRKPTSQTCPALPFQPPNCPAVLAARALTVSATLTAAGPQHMPQSMPGPHRCPALLQLHEALHIQALPIVPVVARGAPLHQLLADPGDAVGADLRRQIDVTVPAGKARGQLLQMPERAGPWCTVPCKRRRADGAGWWAGCQR